MRKWQPEYTQLLVDHYSDKGWQWVQSELAERFSCHFSKKAIATKASKVGVTKSSWKPISEVVQATGAHYQSVIWVIKSNPQLVKRKINGVWKLDKESFDFLVNHFLQPDGWMRADNAADLMGVSHNSILAAAKLGYIESEKKGRYRYVNSKDIQRGIDYLKRTGNINTPWKHLKEGNEAC